MLALPDTQRPIAWRSYYPRRLVRLYVPVWASIVLAVALHAVASSGEVRGSSWLRDRSDVQLGQAWHDAALLDGTGLLNSPLWSLRWEVVFSLALPLYLLVLRRRNRLSEALAVTTLIAAIGVGTVTGSHALRYLPVFGIGVLLAYRTDELEAVARWVDRRAHRRAIRGVAAAAVAALLTARWLVAGLPFGHPVLDALASGATIAGAVAAVVLALHWRPMRRVLEERPTQWLGARSFSLYLVHEPVIVAVALLVPVAWAPGAPAVVGGIVAILVSAIFFRAVERPSISLAHRAGRTPGRPAPRAGPPAPVGGEPLVGPKSTPPQHP